MALKIFEIRTDLKTAIGLSGVPDPSAFMGFIRSTGLAELPDGHDLGAVQLIDTERPMLDFFDITSGILVFTDELYYRPPGRLLAASGKCFPLKLEDMAHCPKEHPSRDRLWLLDINFSYNCLNKPETIFRAPNRRGKKGHDIGRGVVKPVFYPKLVGDAPIFHVDGCGRRMFTISKDSWRDEDIETEEDMHDVGDFYWLCQKLDVKGIKFTQVG